MVDSTLRHRPVSHQFYRVASLFMGVWQYMTVLSHVCTAVVSLPTEFSGDKIIVRFVQVYVIRVVSF